MEALPYYLMMLVHLATFCCFAALWWKERRSWPLLIMMVVTLGIAYDNFIIGFGENVDDLQTLRDLSRPRFWVHGVFTPLIMLVALSWGRDLGVAWARSRRVWIAVGILSIGMSINGLRTDVLQLEIKTTDADGLLRYTYEHPGHALPAAVLTVIVLIGVGIGVWRARRFGWLLGGSVFMFLASGGGTGVPYVANVGETVLMVSMYLTGREAFRVRHASDEPAAAAPSAPSGAQPAG